MKPNVLDMYHGDDNEALPNFAELAEQGIWAIWHKATQGSRNKDQKFAGRIKAAQAAGLLVGAYHFGDNSPVASQVANFNEAIAPFPGIFTGLDYEKLPSGTMTAQQAAEFIEQSGALVLYGSDLIRETRVVRTPSVWLWLAEYGPKESIPAPWTKDTTLLWQFSESGNVVSIRGRVDLNYFNGTQDDLKARWGKSVQTWNQPSPQPKTGVVSEVERLLGHTENGD